MKDKLYCVSLNEFIRVTTGWLYSLAPGNKPRFVNEIVDEIIVRFKRDAQHIGDDFFYYEVDWFQLRVLVEHILMSIKQFRDLNLSKREYGLGIDVDDPNRKEFVFTSLYSSIPEDENFIDLDACIQNIVFSLKQICGKKETRPKGKWIRITQGAIPEQYMCPFCHRTVESYGIEELLSMRYPYCHCGADMRDEGGEE